MSRPGPRIAIVGSRDYPDEGDIRHAIRRIATKCPQAVIISGGARGVDSWAVDEAQRCGLQTEVYPADWGKHGRSAGFIRNKQIVEACDRLLAFWDGSSKGTAHSIRLAREAGKITQVFEMPF